MTVVVGGLFIRETKDHKIDTPMGPPDGVGDRGVKLTRA